VNKTRVEALSDGIFAIAITLLVLTISVPEDYTRLGHELTDRWPSLLAYVVSFAVIGVMWLNHHSVFAQLDHIDRPFVYLNLLLLLSIAFLPYPTGVFGQAMRQGHGLKVAAFAYSLTMVVNAAAWAALWLYAATGRRLLAPSFPEGERRTATVLFVGGTLPYGAALLLALVNAYVCLAFHGALVVYYALDPSHLRRSHDSS
jgi:uncharacterized membrane protein